MAGRYESHYLRAVDPERPARRLDPPHDAAAAGRPAGGVVLVHGAGTPRPARRSTRRSPRRRPTRCSGRSTAPRPAARSPCAATVPGRAAWDLAVAPAAAPLRHLPHPRLYAAPLPRTKLESPAPAARVSGTVAAGGRELALDGWPGMAGHNWGAQHAETWLWLHGSRFAGAAGAWLDLAVGRVRIAGRTTPWIAERRARARRPPPRPGRPARRARRSTRGRRRRPSAPATRTSASPRRPARRVAWAYADPPGGEHHALNCSIAAHRGRPRRPRRSRATHGGVYELGTRDRGHGIPVAPFPDP